MTIRTAQSNTAYQDALGRLLRAGECRVWVAGEDVVSDDENDGLACYTPKGSRGHCYWSPAKIAD